MLRLPPSTPRKRQFRYSRRCSVYIRRPEYNTERRPLARKTYKAMVPGLPQPPTVRPALHRSPSRGESYNMQRWLDEWLLVTDENERGLLETTRERKDQTNRALIWVADDSMAPTLIQKLRRADASAHTERRKLADSTYGIIHLRSHRHSTLYTLLLVAGQCVCYSVLSIYDQSRDGFYLSSNNDSAVRLNTAPIQRPAKCYPDFHTHPTTGYTEHANNINLRHRSSRVRHPRYDPVPHQRE
jgi:hypothetical protein